MILLSDSTLHPAMDMDRYTGGRKIKLNDRNAFETEFRQYKFHSIPNLFKGIYQDRFDNYAPSFLALVSAV